jgi:hypothetical protein
MSINLKYFAAVLGRHLAEVSGQSAECDIFPPGYAIFGSGVAKVKNLKCLINKKWFCKLFSQIIH